MEMQALEKQEKTRKLDWSYQQAINVVLDGLRVRHKLNWTRVAERAEVPASLLAKMRRGERRLNDSHWAGLARAFGITVNYLFEEIAQTTASLARGEARVLYGDEALLAGEPYVNFVKDKLASLEAGDRFFLVTAQPPLEFEPGDLEASIINALKQGAEFTYIVPDYTVLSRIDEGGADASAVPVKFVEFLDRANSFGIDVRFRMFKARVRRAVEADCYDTADVSKRLNCYLAYIPEAALFFAPVVKYVVVGRGDSVNGWIEVAFKAKHHMPRSYMPLSVADTNLLRDWCDTVTDLENGVSRKVDGQ